MKFYGTGQVWDKEKQKVLCEFEGGHYDAAGKFISGVYETEDPVIIKKLEEAGYLSESLQKTQTVDADAENLEAPIAEDPKESKKSAKKSAKAE